MKKSWIIFTIPLGIYSVSNVRGNMIFMLPLIIKGSEWLYNRLDVIGYSLSYEELMKRIWKHDRSVSKELLKEIVGVKGENKER